MSITVGRRSAGRSLRKPPHDVAGGGADLGRAPQAAGRQSPAGGHLRRGEMIRIGQPLPPPRRARMRRHEVVPMRDPQARIGARTHSFWPISRWGPNFF